MFNKSNHLKLGFFEAGFSATRIAIRKHWRVLDIGSGHNPHSRADILLDKDLLDNRERSGKPAVRDARPLVVADAQNLPFKNHSFDYVIASHIAEHTSDPIAFCREIQRVAPRGYVECPGPLGERLLGEPFHLWIVKKKENTLLFKKKAHESKLLQNLSALFYALFYVNQNRARWTVNSDRKIIKLILYPTSIALKKLYLLKFLRPFTYTCFKYNKPFKAHIIT